MNLPLTDDDELQARSHHSRRWLIHLSLVSILAFLLLAIAGLVLTSSS